jgi:tetratricopeptide (TPR) repeat protein
VDSSQYRAFLSYSHSDGKWAAWLHHSLESYRPPRHLVGAVTDRGPVPKRLAPVFRDREELPSATDLGAAISKALRKSECQIVICSKRAARSRWVNEEILEFKRLGREDRIFCLIIDGEPNASDDPRQADEECFPPALRYRIGPDGNLSGIRTEPIAADARRGKDGRSHARLKLIAGMLGLGFDALRQREQQRRNQRLFAIAASALVGMVLTSALAAVALIARATAERETEFARVEARTAQQTTDFLVDLFRISDPTAARGSRVTAREMLDEGAARVRTQLAGQPRIQATLMDTLGRAYMGLGLYGESKPLLEAAVTTRTTLRPPQPDELGTSLSSLGELLTLRAEYPAADQAYRRAIDLQSALPESRRDEAALARSYLGFGSELADRGRLPEGEQRLRQALAVERKYLPGANEDTARTLEALGKVVDRLGRPGEALPLMQQAVAMQRTLWGTQPYPDYADAINDLGLLQLEKGNYRQSEELFRESIAMKRSLLGDKHPEIATGLNNLGLVLEDDGNLSGAESAYREALTMQKELLGEVHPAVANTLNNLAYVLYEKGEVRNALTTERESLDIYRNLFPGDNPKVAGILNTMGFWFFETGKYATAERDIEEGLAMREHLFGKSHPDVAASLTHLAIIQIATHRYAAALASARAAERIWSADLPDSAWKVAVAQSAEGAALAGTGHYAEAEKLLVHCHKVLASDPGAFPMYRALNQRYLDQVRRHGPPPVSPPSAAAGEV